MVCGCCEWVICSSCTQSILHTKQLSDIENEVILSLLKNSCEQLSEWSKSKEENELNEDAVDCWDRIADHLKTTLYV